MTVANLRRDFVEIALSGFRTADELEEAKSLSRGLAPLTELLTRHPQPH
jgi:hypothetical protein